MKQDRAGWAGVIKREPQAVKAEAKAEARRVVAMLAHAAPPADVGPVPVAPARGAQRIVTDYVALPGGMRRAVGKRLEEADVFDRMHAQAQRRHGDSDAVFVAPFSHGQIGMARHYRTLTERHAAGGVRCSSMEAGRGGSGGEFMDAYLAIGRELDRLHARIEDVRGDALRRVRPSERAGHGVVTVRALVDGVCLGNLTLDQVLARHGWACKGAYRQALRQALAAALDRMQGYGVGRTQHVG
jgi:hypothetical protein